MTEDRYGPSTVKRTRRSKADLGDLDDAIVAAVAADHPVTLRGVYYRVVSAGAVDKTENGCRAVGRRLLELHRVVEDQERRGLEDLAAGGWAS